MEGAAIVGMFDTPVICDVLSPHEWEALLSGATLLEFAWHSDEHVHRRAPHMIYLARKSSLRLFGTFPSLASFL
jgi:hypothetical protein